MRSVSRAAAEPSFPVRLLEARMCTSILVIENDADVRGVIADMLKEVGGFTVHLTSTISNARLLLMAATAGDFGLLVLNVSLPDGDGRTFCASLREQGFTLPVILLSGSSHEDDVVRGFEAGADDYLAKPFRVRELLARIRNQLCHAAAKCEPGASSCWV